MPIDPFNPYEPAPASAGIVEIPDTPWWNSSIQRTKQLSSGGHLYGSLSHAFIMVLDPIGEKEKNPKIIYLPYIPDEIGFERTADYDRSDIAFGTEKTLFYKTTSSITFELDWTFVAGVNISDGIKLMAVTQLLHSLVCPGKKPKPLTGTTESGSIDYDRPGVVYVVIGTWLRLRCIVTDVKIVYKKPWGNPVDELTLEAKNQTKFEDSALMPMIADCSASFEATQFYDAHKGVSIPNQVQSLEQAAKRLGAKGLRDRDFIRANGLSNISFDSMSYRRNVVRGTSITR
jgi:hypothetical protein